MLEILGDLLRLLDRLDLPRVHVVGHDWGGAIAAMLATMAPARVASLTCLSVGHPGAFGAGGWRQREKSWYMLLFQFEGIAERWLSQDDFANLRRWSGHPDIDDVVARLRDPVALTAGLGLYRAILPPESLLAHPAPLPPIQAPTMGIWSSGDLAVTEPAMTGTERFVVGGWRYERLDGAGHWMQLEEPDRISALLLDFLAEHPLPTGSDVPAWRAASECADQPANAAMSGAQRSTPAGPARSGSARNTVRTPRSANPRYLPRWSLTVPAGWVAVNWRCRPPAAQPFDGLRHRVPVPADHRHVQHADGQLVDRPADARQLRLHPGKGTVQVRQPDVAPVRHSGRDGQRPRPAAAHDDRHSGGRPRIAGGLRQPHPDSVIRLGAGRPEGPQRLDGFLEPVQPAGGRWEVESEAGVLALPPAGPEPAEHPAAGERVQGGDRLGQQAGCAVGHRADQGAEPEPRIDRAGASPTSPRVPELRLQARPTCGIWMRWSISATR